MKNITQGTNEDFSLNTRLALGTAGVAMLGYFLTTTVAPLGAAVFLPLLAVFPLLLALQGGNPLASLRKARKSSRSSKPSHTTRVLGKTAAHV